MAIAVLIATVFVIIWDMFHGRIFLNSVLLLLLVSFLSGYRLESMHIPHRKYQVKPHSSPWFSTACAAVIVHRNYFFRLYQQNKSSKSKVKFRQVIKRFFKLLNLRMLIKKKSPPLLRNWLPGLWTNWW